MVDAFPWDTAPRYVLRDRDQIYGAYFDRRVEGLGIEQVRTAPRSPWQRPYVERVIGSIRRECLDHMIVLDERHLRRILRAYVDYYHSCRTHLSLEKDAPEPRPVETSAMGRVTVIPKVGGLHHYGGTLIALVTTYRDRGEFEGALLYPRRLADLNPSDASIRQLISQLEALTTR